VKPPNFAYMCTSCSVASTKFIIFISYSEYLLGFNFGSYNKYFFVNRTCIEKCSFLVECFILMSSTCINSDSNLGVLVCMLLIFYA
jgi:hypothetical protein